MWQEVPLDGLGTRTVGDSADKDRLPYHYAKRVLDISLATVLLVILFPLWPVVAVMIKLDSKGPILFTQERVGACRRRRNGHIVWEIRNFSVYKFRSMVYNADPSLHKAYIKAFVEGRVAPNQAEGPKFKLTHDPRITRVGRILRRTSIDELPQLLNVLKGEMSLVGPRPVPTYEVAQYQPWHCERLAALPGMTGLWQVKGRCRVGFDEMMAMDISYVRSQSLWLDLKLLALTLPAVISGDGAE